MTTSRAGAEVPWPAPQGEPDALGFRVVHHPVPRSDGPSKVTGRATYIADIRLPGMTFGKVLRSPVAHARIVAIDSTAALRRPAVVGVVTGRDLLSLPTYTYGHAYRDHPVLAVDKVRFVGEPVAVLVAEDELTAQEAIRDIRVEFEELAPVLTAEEAMAAGAPLVHEVRPGVGGALGVTHALGSTDMQDDRPPSNVCQENPIKWGDIDAAFAKAAIIIEGDYEYPMHWACPLEPHGAVASYGDQGLTVYSCGQHLYMVRRDLADIFGLELNRVQMITPQVGGGFGSKSYTKIEPIAAVASWKVRRPVQLLNTMEDSAVTSRAPDARVHLRTAVAADGRLLGRQGVAYMNTGAYAENSPLVSFKTAMRLTGGYQWDAVDIVSYAVYTNTAPSSSHRMLGTAQSALSGETQIDEAAEALGLDPIAFRIKNVPARGERLYPNQRGLTADARAALARLSDAIGLDEPLPPGRGRGVAFGALDGGGPAVGRSEVRVHGDGSVTLLTGAAELGQGSATVLGQIVAEEMGTTLDRVRVVQSNTLVTPYARSTGAGRTTSLEGLTVLKACREAKAQLREMAADVWEANPDDIVVEPPGLAIDGRFMTWGEVIGKYFGMADMEIIGRGQIRREGELAEAPAWWELAIAGVEVDVDQDTGQWRMTKLVTVADVGLAINPALLDGGDLGASAMGLGVAIGERFVYDGEQLANPSLLDYRVPRFHDIPADVTCIVIENQDGIGPYGAKGNADGAGGVIHAAIANAIYRAVGVRLHEAPFLPERVLTALEQLEAARRPPSDTNRQAADGSIHAN